MRRAVPLGEHVAICFSEDEEVPEEQASPRSASPARAQSTAVKTGRCRISRLFPALQQRADLRLTEAPELAAGASAVERGDLQAVRLEGALLDRGHRRDGGAERVGEQAS